MRDGFCSLSSLGTVAVAFHTNEAPVSPLIKFPWQKTKNNIDFFPPIFFFSLLKSAFHTFSELELQPTV